MFRVDSRTERSNRKNGIRNSQHQENLELMYCFNFIDYPQHIYDEHADYSLAPIE